MRDVLYVLRCAVFIIFASLTFTTVAIAASGTTPLIVNQNCLIVGGGPDRNHNQVAIESNVRFVRSLLPSTTRIKILYDGGRLHTPVVQYQDKKGAIKYRKSTLDHIDGPARLKLVDNELKAQLTTGDPTLLYFTGHGSPDVLGGYKDNVFDLWKDEGLSVTRLTQTIKSIPENIPITLVMAQCFSGAFTQVFLTAGTDQNKPPVRPNSCGFFSSIPQRESAGCTPEVNEANYHDFTTYFFGALSGHDRMGHIVANADYDHNGIVGMDEAYIYALINDRSIDTPTATSDAYVRQYSKTADKNIFATSYAKVLEWANIAQRTGLNEISNRLHISGDNRLEEAYKTFKKKTTSFFNYDYDDEETAIWIRFVRLAKTVVLEHEILNSGDIRIREGLKNLLIEEAKNPLIRKS